MGKGWIRWPITAVVITLGAALSYYLLPDVATGGSSFLGSQGREQGGNFFLDYFPYL